MQLPCRQQKLNRIGDVFFRNVMIAPLDAEREGLRENIRRAEAFRGFEFVSREFDLEAVRILQVDRVHEPAIALYELDAVFTQSSWGQGERCPGHIERQMLHATNLPWSLPSGVLPGFVGEHGEQASIAGVKVQVILIGLAEVGLLEEERHTEHALPEIHRALLSGSDDCDMVNALNLCLFHALLLLRFDSQCSPISGEH